MNRKLIRPNFGDIKEQMGRAPKSNAPQDMPSAAQPALGQADRNPDAATIPQGTGSPRRKIAPPEQTNAESFYYLKQMQTKTPMVIVLQNDEKIRGVIEWYDKHCLKVNRIKEPNLLIPKHNIKYIYKQEEEPRIRRTRNTKKEKEEVQNPDEMPIFD